MEETINNQIFTNSIIDLKDSIFENNLENTKIYVKMIEDSYQKGFLLNDLNLEDLLELTEYNESAVYAANELDNLLRYAAVIEELKSIQKSEYWNEFEWQNFIKEVERFGKDGIVEFLLTYLSKDDFKSQYMQNILNRLGHTYELIDILPYLKANIIENLSKDDDIIEDEIIEDDDIIEDDIDMDIIENEGGEI